MVIVFAAIPTMLAAETWHVAPGGNNGSNGRTHATAWATVQHAADVAVAGDTVLVHPGDYQGFAAMENSGTASGPIVFRATGQGVYITSACGYNGLDGINVEGVEHVVIEGFTVNGMPRTGIRTALSNHVSIRNNNCHGNYKWGILTGFAAHVTIEYNTCSGSEDEHGIYVSNSADDPIIRYNHCFDNRANGIHMNGDLSMGGDGVISGAQVYGNIIHGNGVGGGSGINCDGVVNSTFWNNLVYDNHASGISLYRIDGGAPSTGNKLWNNTIVNAADGRWCVNITEHCIGNQLLNNILINQHAWRGSIVVDASALTGFVSDHNVLTARMSPNGDATVLGLAQWQALGYDTNSLVPGAINTVFAAYPTDLHAVSASAPQVDAGTAVVGPVVITDLDGDPRPQGVGYDIGCFEHPLSTALGTEALHPVPTIHVQGGALLVADPGVASIQVMDAAGRVVARRKVVGATAITLPAEGVLVVQLFDWSGVCTSTQRVVHAY